ncbi:MAG: SUMF1/EgtB/PvdO family nonheme iron enzyme [Polyangiaceae bacterium]
MGPNKYGFLLGVMLVGCGGSAPTSNEAKTAPPAPAPEPAKVAVTETPAATPAETASEEKVSSNAAPAHGPSCDGRAGAANDCGNGEFCCARSFVPEGDVLYRKLDAGPGEKKHVAGFYLDKFEATVGRFRTWVAAGQPVPAVGDVIYDDGQGHTMKWPANAKVQDEKHLEGWKRYDTWTGGDDKRPKNNVSWYTAAAFCKWEGGRLPTDVEWTRAARGGEEDRPYPWGAASPSPEMAVYNCMGDGNKACGLVDILPVGSRPKGIGKWGHYDLAGSMFEWTLQPGKLAGADPTEKARGGGFCYIGGVDRRASTELKPAIFREDSPETQSHMTGVRCAYESPKGAAPKTEDHPSEGGGSLTHAR